MFRAGERPVLETLRFPPELLPMALMRPLSGSASMAFCSTTLPIVAFAVVFLAVVLLVRLGAKALEGVVNLATLGWLNKLGGVVFYALIYLFIFSVLLFYADKVGLIQPETKEASVSFPLLQPLAPYIMEGLGVVLPFFKNMFGELSAFFDGVAQKA